MPDADILIIGAGPAGLSTAGALKQAGLASVILDSGQRIGHSWEQRYDRLHLHTVRAYSGLAHFAIPRIYPKYLSKDQYAEYLRLYAAHFDLNLMPGKQVKRVHQVSAAGGRSGWAVDTGSETWIARLVVIATGQYNQPICPEFPGLSQYTGETLHSSSYNSGLKFQNQHVLVIGAGNSAMEIAVDLVEQGASQVVISVRSAPPIVPRDFLGTPAQVFGILMNSLPSAFSDRVGQAFSRLAMGDLGRFGLPPAAWLPFSAHRTPVIDVGFAAALEAGKISVRPAVSSFTSSGVIYQNNHEESFDVVIFATGFRTGLEQLLEPAGLIDKNGIPLFPSGAPTSSPGLYFMGYYDSLRGFLYESNLASRRLAQEIKSKFDSI
ncbi:MAG: NAD(P)/FAD-dependent oxidoreductase [Anaerolineaceae bacterium]|nr:NAD(P)/FAD-dependent oxidoreductase [Anaerolineaceae bacterium]